MAIMSDYKEVMCNTTNDLHLLLRPDINLALHLVFYRDVNEFFLSYFVLNHADLFTDFPTLQ